MVRSASLLVLAALVAAAWWAAGTSATTDSIASPATLAAGGPVPARFSADSVTFVSAEDGWVLGTAPCRHQPCTSVLHTTDGGAGWQGLPAPRAQLFGRSLANSDVSEIRFANARDGFAFDPGLWVTSTGGERWTRVSTLAGMHTYEVQSLAATGDGDVYLLASAGTAEYPQGQSRLYRAAPGQTTFRLIASLPGGAGVGWALTAGGARVYVTGPDARRIESFGPGGKRVSELPARHAGDSDDACGLAATSASALIAECGNSESSGAFGSRILLGSTDGGSRWTVLGNPGRGDGYDAKAVAETADRHAVVSTGDAAAASLRETSDGGRHWRTALQFSRNTDGASFSDLGFENDADGVAIFSGGLWRTVDGGVRWYRVRF